MDLSFLLLLGLCVVAGIVLVHLAVLALHLVELLVLNLLLGMVVAWRWVARRTASRRREVATATSPAVARRIEERLLGHGIEAIVKPVAGKDILRVLVRASDYRTALAALPGTDEQDLPHRLD